MKIDEVKLRIKNFLNRTVDLYLPCNNLISKLENATAKVYIEQHLDSLNNILLMFSDTKGEIDEKMILKTYEDALFDENGDLQVNIKELIEEECDINVSFLPDKIILFKKEDLHKIFY